MFSFNMTSPAEVIGGLSERMKRRRIDAGLTQRELAIRAGVSYGSLRLFEETGKISLEALVKIAFVLEAEAEFEHLFPPRPPKTIDDVIGRPVRQRVRKRAPTHSRKKRSDDHGYDPAGGFGPADIGVL
ncbi:helix-turn-helix domain-containing protein [Rhizobium leguminosarum]|uniref:helix-turn-helix domain-containing protein n=1 Tax=Rhizobium leguminosarum TaxID=384 RepID=UPI0021BC0E5A|nr:helix-turn-helix transcriptional regulator [Rhizobium leguminosarum]